MRRPTRTTLLTTLLLLLSGCAATTVQHSGSTLAQPLCRADGPPLPVALYWLPQWRPDQKEPATREALAQRGITLFFSQQRCLSLVALQRLPSTAGTPSDQALLHRAATAQPSAQRVILLVVRELGPTLALGLPVPVRGGTEVVIETRVLDPATAQPLASTRTEWRNGGPFVVKGVWSLEQDMRSALHSALMAGQPAP